jgi:hypothetical protein
MGYRLNAGALPVFAMAYLCDALSLRLAPLGIFPFNFPVHIAGAPSPKSTALPARQEALA